MEILNTNDGKKGKFCIQEHGKKFAEMDYEIKDKISLIITHTGVDETHEGQGTGRKLVLAAAEYAKRNSLKLQATCSFAKSILDVSPEYGDIYNV